MSNNVTGVGGEVGVATSSLAKCISQSGALPSECRASDFNADVTSQHLRRLLADLSLGKCYLLIWD